MNYVRYPIVAGQFYPDNKEVLLNTIKKLLETSDEYLEKNDNLNLKKYREFKGFIVPHAGIMFSGFTASFAYNLLKNQAEKVKNVILIGPNHTGYGPAVSIFEGEKWVTPLGDVYVNQELAEKIASLLPQSLDVTAHRFEHSIEVQLPFLSVVLKDFKIVPITMLDQSMAMAKLVAKAIEPNLDDETVVIATTDLTHYEQKNVAYMKDSKLIEVIIQKDVEKIYETIAVNRITACGYGPVASLVEIFNEREIVLLNYTTSGDFVESDEVVGYASLAIK